MHQESIRNSETINLAPLLIVSLTVSFNYDEELKNALESIFMLNGKKMPLQKLNQLAQWSHRACLLLGRV